MTVAQTGAATCRDQADAELAQLYNKTGIDESGPFRLGDVKRSNVFATPVLATHPETLLAAAGGPCWTEALQMFGVSYVFRFVR